MAQIYTPEKLIEIIYGEAPFSDYFDLDEAMQANPDLRCEFRELYDSYKLLDSITFGPSTGTINNILNYAS